MGARLKDKPLDYTDGKRVGVLSYEGVFYELSLGGGDMRRCSHLVLNHRSTDARSEGTTCESGT